VEFTFSPLVGIAGAALLGGAVGIQRQAVAKPAGFRTHLLVAAAAASFTAMGAYLHDTRIPSYVVVGIGFLGAGAIVRQGTSARGLTTAASIWTVAAIGLALGYHNSFGLYVGLLLTALTLLALILSDDDIMRWCRIPRLARIRVTCTSSREATEQIAQSLLQAGVRVRSVDVMCVSSEESGQIIELVYLLSPQHADALGSALREIGTLSVVRRVEFAEPLAGEL
jgi:putative Mg2+ transporter-C (MgtC) family protein